MNIEKIILEPQVPDESDNPKELRVAAYCRVSTDIGASLNGVGKRKGTHALPLSSCDIEKIISDVNSNITEYK